MRFFQKNTAIVFLISFLLMFIGCGDAKIDLQTDSYFLCGTETNYDAGIEIYNSHGKNVFQLSNACVEQCILSDGTLLNQSAGLLPSNSVVFIKIKQNTDTVKTGVWGTTEKDWLIPPVDGYLIAYTRDGKLTQFVLNDTYYGIDFIPMESETPDIYEFLDGTKLTNSLDGEGNYYISTVNGDYYLDGHTLYEKNRYSGLLLTEENSISIQQCILNQYMIVEYDYTESTNDTDIVITGKTYLCDLNGVIQHPEWNYDGVTYVFDQFDNIDTQYLVFSNSEDLPFHYLDTKQDKEVIFPDGYGNPFYAGKGFFILKNEEKFTIYDAVDKEIGNTFTVQPGTSEFILGKDTYIIQNFKESMVVIGGIQKEIDVKTINDIPVTTHSTYPVIQYKTFTGDSVSYIVDTKGHPVLKARQNIIYADESYYLVLSDNKYKIQMKKRPISH